MKRIPILQTCKMAVIRTLELSVSVLVTLKEKTSVLLQNLHQLILSAILLSKKSSQFSISFTSTKYAMRTHQRVSQVVFKERKSKSTEIGKISLESAVQRPDPISKQIASTLRIRCCCKYSVRTATTISNMHHIPLVTLR